MGLMKCQELQGGHGLSLLQPVSLTSLASVDAPLLCSESVLFLQALLTMLIMHQLVQSL